ncbi:MAG: ABC-F family ATP-binding cassette domain-containing protein [Cyclobacteriaceae bacterium]|nr:ABC-F family ATP-binding cassette domain-containing protein [Cyclobacteriaceae bacterium]MCH8515247.1 ABC-F family ATP-binding cassette domain-containing protein [Cyclobacteriaceae bacterium]
MNYLSAEKLSKAYQHKVLFEELSFGIEKGEKIALIGTNGTGKSTLLKIIAGQESADAGEVQLNKSIKVGYLPQQSQFEGSQTILETVLAADNADMQALKKYTFALEGIEGYDLNEALEEMENRNAWDLEAKVKEILGHLDLHQPSIKVGVLSGGQLKRVALAKTLLGQPDFMILDEPTNHLDLQHIEWLENYLAQSKVTLLMVTHDKYFLENVTNHIFELEFGKLYKYKGSYTYFLEKKQEREEREQAEIGKAKNLLKKEMEWLRRQPKARGTKAKYRVDAVEEIQKKATSGQKEQDIELQVQGRRQGKKVIELENISFSYPDGKEMIQNFSYIFKRGEKLGIIGPNGSGKTTFLKLLTGELQPTAGQIDKGINTKIGYYKQQDPNFDESKRVIDVITEIADQIEISKGIFISASQMLEKFLFTPKQQYNLIKVLSGGERRRLSLLQVLMGNPNFLILDEPTNDLDLQTLGVLEEFLIDFPASVLMVSHDRYFMDKLNDGLLVFSADSGDVVHFPGNYTDYREQKKEEEAEQSDQKKSSAKPVSKDSTSSKGSDNLSKNLSYKEKREYESLENEIAVLEHEKEELVSLLNKEGNNHEQLLEYSKQIEHIEATLEQKTDRWLELADRM